MFHSAGRSPVCFCQFRTATLLSVLLLAACGSGEITMSEINDANVLNNQPATLREGGEVVTGTVVEKTAEGLVLRRVPYVDGFPNGLIEEWHPNGQKKSEKTLKYVARGPRDGGLMPAGPSRTWCENGTLQVESDADAGGSPVGIYRNFTCTGQPLSERTMPIGPMKTWAEVQGSDKTVLVEEGTTVEGDGWEGVHKQYYLNGSPKLEEHWVAGALDGTYRTWKEDGTSLETGTYQAGNKMGTWVVNQGTRDQVTEYDESLFIDSRYSAPFMSAAGIYIGAATALNNARPDLDKARYFIDEGLVDVKKRLNLLQPQPGIPFSTNRWTYPYILASSEVLPLLIEQGADPKSADSEGRTRLFFCIYSLGADRFCNAADAKQMIETGIPVNQQDTFGNTVLHEVVKTHTYIGGIVTNEKRHEVGTMLMDAGADPDIANREATTPLMLAVTARQFPLATEMLNRSKNPTALDGNGLNLIHLAFFIPLGNQVRFELTPPVQDFLKLAVSKGIDPLAPLGESGTLKEIAEQIGAIDAARFLTELKAGS